MKIKKAVPHLFTSGNLLCGCLAIVKAFEGNLVWSAYLVGIAALLDFFDGFAARALKVSGDFGKQLDSLADCVTFGVVPGMALFLLMKHYMVFDSSFSPGIVLSGAVWREAAEQMPLWKKLLPYSGFLISVFSALRLAKFNIDTRQSDSFIGVPTPANTIFIMSFPLIIHAMGGMAEPVNGAEEMQFNSLFFGSMREDSEWLLLLCGIFLQSWKFYFVITLLMSFLLVAELPLFALKFRSFKWKGNEIRFVFLLLSLLLLVFLKFVALPLIIVLYILMSVIHNLASHGRKGESTQSEEKGADNI